MITNLLVRLLEYIHKPPNTPVSGTKSTAAGLTLALALDVAAIGVLADVTWELHNRQMHNAVIYSMIASVCFVVLAGAHYFAHRLMSKR